jgi:hypothetical protein
MSAHPFGADTGLLPADILTNPARWQVGGYGYAWPQPPPVATPEGMLLAWNPAPTQFPTSLALHFVRPQQPLQAGQAYTLTITAAGDRIGWHAEVAYQTKSARAPAGVPHTVQHTFVDTGGDTLVGLSTPRAVDWRNAGTHLVTGMTLTQVGDLLATPTGDADVLLIASQPGTLLRDGVPVRGGQLTEPGSILDREAPAGRTLTYTLVTADDPTLVAVAVVVVDPTVTSLPTLQHPYDDTLRVPFTIVDDTPRQAAVNGTVHRPLDGLPRVVYRGRDLRTGTLTVRCTAEQDRLLDVLLADGSPMLLRTPAGCPVQPDRWLHIDPAIREHTHPHANTFQWQLPYTQVQRPAGDLEPPLVSSYLQVRLTYPTYAALLDAHPTYRDLLITPSLP